MRRNRATSRRRSGRAARVCIWATFGTGTSDSNTSSATTTRRPGSSSAVDHDSSVVLPDPGGPANTIESRARTQARRNAATRGLSMSRSTSSPGPGTGCR
jgi:hypothetical protein